jgi:GxxExxY protein
MNADFPAVAYRPITAALTGQVIGVFYDVYNDLGFGFLESVYRQAMLIALTDAGLRARAEVPVNVIFRGRDVGLFKADLVVEGALVLELKTSKAIHPIHEAQILNFLHASRLELGLLFNFGPKPEFRRLISSNDATNLR